LQKHPDKTEQISKALCRNAKRLQKLTDDILDVSRIESQTLKLSKEQFNLNDVISYIVEDFRCNIEQEGHSNVELIYDAVTNNNYYRDLSVEADKARITRVICNLLNNAIKFTRSGLISVKCRREYQTADETNNNSHQGNAIITIKDTGSGISPDIFYRLFMKFATNSNSGTGLGLFISKNIVEAHGGKIWAENNQNESGASFSFSLPIVIAKNGCG
jgi:signal transduction histidine kinase